MLPLLECLTLLCLAPGILNQPSPDCLTPQGMQSGAIEDAHLVVSSQADGKSKEKARYGCCQDECRAAWCPQDNDTSPYYEVHFKTPTSVSALAFQHPTSANQACNFYAEDFMQTFRLLFKPVIGTGELVEFNQNISAIQNESLTYEVQFEPSFVTQTIRIEPQDYQNNACFKFEVYGCEPSVLCPRDFCKNNGLCMGTNLCKCTQGYFGKTCELQEVDIKSTVYNLLFTKIEEHILHTTEFSMKLSGSVHLEEVSGQKIMILGEGGAGQVITTGQSDLCLKDIDQCHAGFSYSLNLNIEKIQSEKKRIIFLSNGNDFNTEKGIWLFYEHNVFTCYAGTSEEFWSVQVSHALTVGAWYKLAVSWNRALGLQLLLNNQVIGSKVQSMRRHTDSYTSEPLTIGSTSNHGVTYRVFLLQLAPLVASEVLRANIAEITPPSLPTGENITTPPPQPLPTTVQSASAATNDVTPAVTRDVSLTTDVTQGCESALGMRGGEITEDDIMVSSSSPGHGKQKLRHDCCTGEELGGWCADSTDKDPWVEIRFPMPKVISKVVFQLPACPDNLPRSYVTAVDVLYHNLLSPSNHLELYAEHVQAVTNGSSNTVALRPEIVTDRVRMSINSSVGQPCMRFELIGCEQKVSRENQATSSATTETAAPTPEPSICESSMTDISFMSINGTELLTSLSTMAVHGAATIEASPDGTLLILDGQGQYIDMQKTGIACLDDITTCGTRFNFRLTFKFITIDIEKNYILSSGGNINNSSGISLYYWHDTLNFWVKYGKEVYMSIYQANLSSDTWYTVDASWDKDSGNTSIYLNGEAIKAKQRRHYPAPEPTEKHSLLLGKSPEGEHTSRMKLLLVRLWTDTYTRLTDQNCTRELQLPIVAATASTPPTTTTTQETIKSINLAFTSIRGKTLVTSSFNLTVSGSPQLIQDRNITFLQLNGTNQGLEIPQNSLPCLTSTINCHSGFTFQIGIMIQFIKAQEKTILVSNGKNSSSTMSLYYESKHLHLIVFRGKEKWVVTVPYTIHTNKLNIYQISWSMTEGLQLYENNVLLGIEKNPISVSTSHTSTSNIHVGMTSATLLITSIQTWTASRLILSQRGILERTESCHGTPVDSGKLVVDLSFKSMNKNILTSTDMNILVHGGPDVILTHNETSLDLSEPGRYLEIETHCLPCLSDLLQCSSGFTIQLEVILKDILGFKTYIIDSSNLAQGYTSLSLFYEGERIKGNVIVGERKWLFNIPFELKVNSPYLLQLSWSNLSGLHLYIDELCVLTLPDALQSLPAVKTPPLFLIGKAATTNDTSAMIISKLKIYLATREKLVKLGILKPPVTTMSTTTLTPPTVPTVPEFIWNFVNIKTDILVSSFLELNVHGQPRGDITGIILQTSKEYLEISNLGMTCLTDIRLCRNGLTLAIELLFNKLEENTVILTTGAETPDLPGISVLYRYGHFHIIFSSTTEAWFVSIPREHISTGVSHTLMISWHQSLKVYVDQMLRGTAKEHVSHPDTGHELKEQLFIGHPFTSLTSVRPVNCVLTTFHIWYKFIDELQKTGAVVIKEEKTTLKPGICSAGCIPTTTTVMPTTPTTTTTPKATTRPTTESTTPKPTTLPDVGVPSFRPLLSLRPVVDQTGTYLACSVGTYSEKNVHIEFMWFINNVAQIAKSVNTPLKEGRLYASEIKGVQDNLLNSVIFCTAKAKFITGRQWSSTQQSMTFVPHITMLTATREKIVLIEGHQGTTIDLHTNCPPSLFCKVKDKGECKVEIVATLQTNGHDRKCTHEVVLPQLVVHQSVSTPAVCGQVMTSSNWKQAITIPIKATVDGLQDKDQLRNLFIQLKVTGGVDKETLTQKIEEYQVLVKDKDTYRASTCSSLNDPHIATFDGLHYNNFQEGEYVLYRHKTLPYEVRAQYRRCSTRHSRGPTCNCAVAVQSGDDVITISGCHGSSGRRSIFSRFIHHHSPPMTVELYKNGELTPGTTIRRIGCGQTYEIRLPTGTTITVKTSFKSFINVWVRASAVDFQQSLGLCGSFNGNKGDDLYGFDQKTYRYTKQPDEFCKTWHVSEKATIFHGVSAHSVGTDTYCSCVQGKQLYCAPSLDIFRCATTTTSRDDVTATLVRQAKVPGPSLRRSKRAVTFDLEPLAFDQSDETGPVSNYTTTSATQYCQQYLETQTATKTCKQFVDVTQDLLSDCAEDLVQTGDEGWAQSHLDDIITKCVSEAVRTAPFTNTTLAESVPHDVVSKLCTQLCQQGTCQEASCVCDDGYTGITCDVSKVTKPEIVPVSEDGSGCNIKEGCTDVAIMGVNFVESESLKCFYQLVDVTSEMTTLGPWIPSQATYLSTYQVVCSLPPHSARVGVSNDGVQSSDNSYLHVVHDDCHTCAVNEEGTDAQCHKKTDTCVISGACFLSGEKMVGSECRVCEPSVSQDMWTLSSDPLCSATKLSHTGGSEESISTTTILLAVLVALLALIIVVGVVVYCKKRTPVRKKLVEEGEYNFSSPQSRLSSMPRPNMRDISFSNAVYDGRAQSLQPDMREGKPVEMREREPVEMRGRKPVEMMENL